MQIMIWNFVQHHPAKVVRFVICKSRPGIGICMGNHRIVAPVSMVI
jgi:hypothetical protein